jgi:inorganic pyrophosphatase
MESLVEVVIETPRDSRNVYEVDDRGQVRFDRRLPGSFAYPADYGYVVGATGTDGEPLDALVLMPEPTYPGVRVRARVVGVFWIRTGHGREAKLVCVPDGDPAYDAVSDLDELPAHQLREISHFFDIYRDLDPGKDVSSDGQDGATAAIQLLRSSRFSGGHSG